MSVRFTTNADYLTGATPSAGQKYTVICWFKIDALPGTGVFNGIWSVDDNNEFIQPYFEGTTGTISHGFAQQGGAGDAVLLTTPAANTWYWIASVILPGATSYAWLGKAGAPLKKTNSNNVTDTLQLNATLYLSNESAADETFNGAIAGFMLYERVLTDPEILRQYKQLAPISRNGLKYYLPLNLKQAPHVKQAGFGSNFTLHGSPGFASLMPPVPEVLFTRSPLIERLNSSTGTTFDRTLGDGIVTVVTF